jgi:hypothetical protein
MTKRFVRDTMGWGAILWLIGYLLGIGLFMLVPHTLIGWIIMPIGILLTLWVLLKKVDAVSLRYYLLLGFVWMLIAITFDYFLLVQVFKPADGYYKIDVYLYYAFTFLLPILVGWRKSQKAG